MSKQPKLSLAAIVAAASPPERPAPGRGGAGLRSAEIVSLAPATKPDGRAGDENEKTGESLRAAQTLKQRARQMSVYLEPPVYDQLRDLAYAERTKMHGLMLEALDLLFKQRGARSIAQLTDHPPR
ncbi:ribbon-helix-helix domain-containing protein [Methylobacterium persicinum]|uniref:Antitoxin-like ribbon-helix-helix domain-containing protein n=1 Tax=Methylobacterium persicinum TaxID=374426 RepID=A0ABU0HMH0_9HYPH|nr:ribbon-helix-helix domain-containing protein [Methylobacterium persicinum]MDQ0443023.1 hypothetical protein [Methylobacterium persicinum]GJE39060.1 hypothetical protein KHHGKMAE_3139 [Methylobacterium persicinum]